MNPIHYKKDTVNSRRRPFLSPGNLRVGRTFIALIIVIIFYFLSGIQEAKAAAPSNEWWDSNYSFRKKITITAGSTAIPSGYSVSFSQSTATLITNSKLRSDGNDWRVVYWNGTSWVELYRWVDDIIGDGWNSANTKTWFKTQASINASSSDDNYYVYYGYADETQAPPAYMSDSMGADAASEVFWYADDFEEHAANTDPDGWTDQGTEDFKVMLQGSEKWFQRTTRVAWNDGSTASSMANIGDAVWSAKLYYHQSGSNAWGGIGVHIANGSVGRTILIRDQAYYHADEVIGGGSWITNTDIHFPLGTKGRIELVTSGTNLDAYWYNPSGYSPDKVTLFTGYTMLSGTGKLGVYVESPDGVSNFRWVDVDDIIVRKYVSPEPTASLDAEEEPAPALSDWSYRKSIVIDSTKVSADLTDFPLLINLSSDSDLASYAQDNGNDILFTSSSVNWATGTNSDRLDHEIEKFNGSNGELIAWVRIPSLSSTTDTVIYMYYGNSGISNQQNPDGVWSDYEAVYHLHDDFLDSTSNSHDGTNVGSTDVGAKIADGQAFDNVSQKRIEVGTWTLPTTNQITLQCWMNVNNTTADDPRFISKANSTTDTDHDWMLGMGGTGEDYLRCRIYTSAITTLEASSLPITAGVWYWVACVYDGTNVYLYRNGEQAASVGKTGNLRESTRSIWLGRNVGGTTYAYTDGKLDEIRVCRLARSANWLTTEYNNQNSPSTFYSLGNGEEQCTYSYKKQITIQSSQVVGTSDLLNFPALIDISSDNDLRTAAYGGDVENTNGYDIVFKDSGGTQLDHEIEEYDGTSGKLVAWVRIPTLKWDENTIIYMHYGSSCVINPTANPTGVWDSNYVGVWHLKEEQTGQGNTGLYKDSTSNNNDGDDQVAATGQNGKINGGQQFSGSGDRVEVPHHSSLNLTGSMTISFWMYPSQNTTSFNRVVDKGYSTSYYFGCGFGTNDLTFYLSNTEVFDTADNTFTINEWHHAAVTYNRTTGNATLILDGTESGPWNYVGAITGNTNIVYISHSNATYDFTGYIDEVRISNTDRSVDWLKTEHNNQSNPSAFYSIGAEEAQCPFSYRKQITIQSSQVSGSSYLSDFPVLISLTGDWLKTTTADSANGRIENANGYDIIFRGADDTTQLDHEIEEYDGSASGGTLIAWVRIPTLKYNENTIIYMYYGNSCIKYPTENPTGVWDSNYVGVWHLSGTSGNELDSTSNNNDATISGAIREVSGKIASAHQFDGGAGDKTYAPDNNTLEGMATLTAEAWIYPTALADYQQFIDKGGSNEVYHLKLMATGSARASLWTSSGSNAWSTAAGTIVVNNWYHVALVYDGSNGNVYVNGVHESTSDPLTGNITTSVDSFDMGGSVDGTMIGKLDEVRISKTARSADWIQTEHNNQSNPSAFYNVGGEEVQCTFSYRKQITIQSSQVSGSSNLSNFPVLISLSGSWLRTTTADPTNGHIENASGYDIIFRDSNTIQLDHEIEEYDGSASGGTLIAWVRIPVLKYNENTIIYMYYGNSCINSSTEYVTGVWDSNYKGVWHMHNSASPATDSTSNANNGTQSGGVTFGATGEINGATSYDGTDDYVQVSANSSITNIFSAGGTISAWIYPTGWGENGYGRIVDKTTSTDGWNGPCLNVSSSALLEFARGFSTTIGDWYTPSSSLSLNAWQHVAVVYNESSTANVPILYINGVSQSLGAYSSPSGSVQTDAAQNMRIGNFAGDTTRTFAGIIDEVRISNIARDPDWIETEHNNQSNPSNFYTVADEEELGCTYSYKKQIAIQSGKVSGTSDLSSFPALISLSGSWLKTTTADPANGRIKNSNGYDIIFQDSSGTVVDHEIEKYDGTNGTLIAWVRIPTLKWNDNTNIYMYYGNGCITSSQENITGVWSNYNAVWHLKESGSGQADEFKDSTSYGNHGQGDNLPGGSVPDQDDGKIWKGQRFTKANSDCIFIGDPANGSLDFGSGSFTYSMWVNIASYPAASSYYNLWYKGGTNVGNPGYDLEMDYTPVEGASLIDTLGVSRGFYFAAPALGQWHYVAVVVDRTGGYLRVYLNGPQVGTDTLTGFGSVDNSQSATIGASADGSWPFDGKLDEVRVSNVVRSPDWLKTEYDNQDSPSTFYQVGDEAEGDLECTYAHRKKITIQSSQVSGTSDLSNFPALVSLSGGWLKTAIADPSNGRIKNINGYDIIFKDLEGRQLDHEMEQYDGTNGTLIAWVRIPTLKYNEDTVVYMYYGNGCISFSQENAAGVWDTNYKGVWHLKETPTVNSYAYDSTSNDNDGSFEASMTSADQVTGQVDGSLDFDGSDDYLDAGSDTSLIIYNSDFTWEAWAKLEAKGGDRDIITKAGDGVTVTAIELRYDVGDDYWEFNASDGAWQYAKYTQANPQIGTYYHIAGVRDGSTIKIYVNGVEGAVTDTLGTLSDSSSFSLLIGRMLLSSDPRYFQGTIDEVRVSNIARSADWIKTSYNNQSNPSAFYIIGDEEGYAPTAVDLVSFTATGHDDTVLVEWETAQEINNLGFNLYRSSERYGSYTKLNRQLIPGLISSVSGKQYTYTDKNVSWGVLYYYLLEDVDLSGTRTMHGPVCVDWDGDGIPDDYDEQTVDDDSDDDTGDDPEVKIPVAGLYEVDLGSKDWSPSSNSSATWVKLTSFRALQEEEGVALEWETNFEVDILGFHVYREEDGKFYRITADLVPGSVFKVGAGRELPAGHSYVYFDGLSRCRGQELYWLDCVELNGGRVTFGPIEPEVYGEPVPERLRARFRSISEHQISRAEAIGKVRTLREELSTRPPQEQKSQAVFYQFVPGNPSGPRLPPSEEQWALSAQPGLKISIKKDGWYRVGEPELVAAGLRSGTDPRFLQLYADGEEQSMKVAGSDDGRFDPEDGIEFYGTGLDTPFTDARAYWLVVGERPGRRLDTPFTDIRVGSGGRMRIPRGLRGRGAPLSFPFSVELKEHTFYFAALKNGEGESFFGSVISTDPVNQLLTVTHADSSPPEDALLEVVVQGATDFSHQIKIQLNYREVGEVVFNGQELGAVRIQVPQGYLLEGDNIVTLAALGGDLDVSLVDYIRLTYWRTYTADEDSLKFSAMGGEWVSIEGFSSAGIRVVDITDSIRMFNVRGKVRSDGSGYAVTFKVPRGGERTLFAFSEENVKQPAGIAANLASSWHEINQGAEVVVIAHGELLESVRSLKELREQQGWSVVLVDVEDLYDEFNFGARSPWALKDFLTLAYEYWNPQPRYLILVGDTSYDPRNYLGYGEFDLVPTKFVDTEYLKTASDDWFVDFDNDGLPEMAVGRLPVESAVEAAAVVSKIIRYEDSAGLMNEALLVADVSDFFDFEGASSEVRSLLPGDITVREIFRGQSSTARTDLLNLLNQGQLLVNYLGHGSIKIWKGNLLTSLDAWNLTNSPYLPFLISMTCLNGFFQDPYAESMAETFMKAEWGGAVAVWTSSGLTYPGGQIPMNKELIQLLFNGQGMTIGEAIMGAKQAADNRDIRRTWILFGDPTLKIK